MKSLSLVGTYNTAAVDGPIIPSMIKNDNEIDLEKKRNMPLMINLDL